MFATWVRFSFALPPLVVVGDEGIDIRWPPDKSALPPPPRGCCFGDEEASLPPPLVAMRWIIGPAEARARERKPEGSWALWESWFEAVEDFLPRARRPPLRPGGELPRRRRAEDSEAEKARGRPLRFGLSDFDLSEGVEDEVV